MCEIQFLYGLEGNLSEEDLEVFKKMLAFGAQMNNDATGLMKIDGNGRIFTAKAKNFNVVTERIKLPAKVLLGHNRQATCGDKTDLKNAHPFANDRAIWVHNGVISNAESLFQNFKLSRDEIETDSYIIGKLVQYYVKNHKKKFVQAIQKTFARLEGSYSVLIYSRKEDVFYYVKNETTDFTFALARRDGQHIIIGSTDVRNIENAARNEKYGFLAENGYDILGLFDPEPEVIYRISDDGIFQAAKVIKKGYLTWDDRRYRKGWSSWNEPYSSYSCPKLSKWSYDY